MSGMEKGKESFGEALCLASTQQDRKKTRLRRKKSDRTRIPRDAFVHKRETCLREPIRLGNRKKGRCNKGRKGAESAEHNSPSEQQKKHSKIPDLSLGEVDVVYRGEARGRRVNS